MDDREYLTPEELDFRRDASVTALGDGRYVIATDGEAAAESSERRETAEQRQRASEPRPETEEHRPETTGDRREVTGGRRETEPDEETARPDYFVSLAARTDEGTFDTRVAGDDIGAVCAAMLRWYARRVAPEDDPREVLSILLSRSDFGVTGPVADR